MPERTNADLLPTLPEGTVARRRNWPKGPTHTLKGGAWISPDGEPNNGLRTNHLGASLSSPEGIVVLSRDDARCWRCDNAVALGKENSGTYFCEFSDAFDSWIGHIRIDGEITHAEALALLDESRPRCAAELRRQLKEMGFDVAEPGGEAKAEPVDDGIDWGLIEEGLMRFRTTLFDDADAIRKNIESIDRQLAAVRRKGATHA